MGDMGEPLNHQTSIELAKRNGKEFNAQSPISCKHILFWMFVLNPHPIKHHSIVDNHLN